MVGLCDLSDGSGAFEWCSIGATPASGASLASAMRSLGVTREIYRAQRSTCAAHGRTPARWIRASFRTMSDAERSYASSRFLSLPAFLKSRNPESVPLLRRRSCGPPAVLRCFHQRWVFTNPSGSPSAIALPFPRKGNRPTLIERPSSFARASVIPMLAICGRQIRASRDS